MGNFSLNLFSSRFEYTNQLLVTSHRARCIPLVQSSMLMLETHVRFAEKTSSVLCIALNTVPASLMTIRLPYCSLAALHHTTHVNHFRLLDGSCRCATSPASALHCKIRPLQIGGPSWILGIESEHTGVARSR